MKYCWGTTECYITIGTFSLTEKVKGMKKCTPSKVWRIFFIPLTFSFRPCLTFSQTEGAYGLLKVPAHPLPMLYRSLQILEPNSNREFDMPQYMDTIGKQGTDWSLQDRAASNLNGLWCSYLFYFDFFTTLFTNVQWYYWDPIASPTAL